MTKQKSTKRALLMSGLALLMCVSMLIGSTFAWFTDSVTSGNNKIVAGTLKVDLEVLGEDGKYVSVRDMNGPIFDYELWEPGYTEVKTLKIQNEGNLALKYQLNVIAEKADSILANVIDVYMCFDESTATSAADLADTSKWWKCGTLAEMMADPAGFTQGKLLPAGAEYDGALLGQNGVAIGEITASIALHMQESAGNEYQGLDLGNIDITLLATQFTYEEDSFDDQYDKDAAYPVATADELADALANGEDVVLANDLTVEQMEIPAGTSATLDLNGYTLTGAEYKTATGADSRNNVINNYGELTITGEGTIRTRNLKNNVGAKLVIDGDITIIGGVAAGGSAIWNEGDCVINGATITQTNDWNYAVQNVADNATMVINDATVSANHGAISNTGANTTLEINGGSFECLASGHTVYASAGTVTINGGSFKHSQENATAEGNVVVYASATVVINGGSYDSINAAFAYKAHSENITVNAGEFANKATTVYGGDFAQFVAATSTATTNADGSVTVTKN